MDDGPFCRALDEALGTLKVHREAYYGNTFTGNHAHKCLKVTSQHNQSVHVHYNYISVHTHTHTL